MKHLAGKSTKKKLIIFNFVVAVALSIYNMFENIVTITVLSDYSGMDRALLTSVIPAYVATMIFLGLAIIELVIATFWHGVMLIIESRKR